MLIGRVVGTWSGGDLEDETWSGRSRGVREAIFDGQEGRNMIGNRCSLAAMSRKQGAVTLLIQIVKTVLSHLKPGQSSNGRHRVVQGLGYCGTTVHICWDGRKPKSARS